MTEIQTAAITNQSDGPCPPVGYELGNPADVALFDAFPDTFAEVGAQVEQSYAYRPDDLETGEAARQARIALGCGVCSISHECVVGTMLEDKIETGAENEVLKAKLDMLQTAPKWLNAGRLSRSHANEKQLAGQLQSVEATREALASGELDIDALLGDVENRPEGILNRSQVPELASFTAIDPEAPLDAHRITTSEGNQFVVIDASKATGFKGDEPELADYKVLSGKLLGRMTETSGDGSPHITHPDQKMQKPIRRLPDTRVDELRMNGKNRMYISVVDSPEDQPDLAARIVILGAHGGDTATQQRFINTVIPER